jgi:hypothetical protein
MPSRLSHFFRVEELDLPPNQQSTVQKSERTEKKCHNVTICACFDYWPAIFISSLALAGALTSYIILKQSEDSNADSTILRYASDRATVLVWELQRVLGDLQTVTAYMAVSYDWREDYFREKFKNLTSGILDRSPGTQGLTWVPMVSDPAERAYLEEQQARQLNLPSSPAQSRITSSGRSVRCFYYRNAAGASLCSAATPQGGPWNAAGDGIPHAFFPVLFLEPVEDPTKFRSSNAAAILFDLSSNTARNASISKAILTASPSATSRLLLVQARRDSCLDSCIHRRVHPNNPAPSFDLSACVRWGGKGMGKGGEWRAVPLGML